MSLKRFREENKKKKQIIIFTIVCILLIAGVFLYQSYALFETKDNFNVVSGNVENPGDISFAFYVNDEIVLEAPSKESNLALSEKSNCNNGVTVSWNVDSWNASVDYSNYKQENTSKTKCNLFFRDAMYSDYITSCGENGNTAVDCMKKYSDKDTINLAYDETVDNNLRYIGANPDNYVSFNNELWRIIGVMENIEDGTDKKETRIKLIHEESIGRYAWDSSASNVNGGDGVNEWSQAKLNTLLNDYYYNRKTNQNCYNGGSLKYTNCSFDTNGIQEDAKNLFKEAVWHTAAYRHSDFTTTLIDDFYLQEHSNLTGKICTQGTDHCNDNVTRTVKWTGKIALISGADYGYATSGNEIITRETCLSTPLRTWNQECYENNWINKGTMFWLINPIAASDFAHWTYNIKYIIGVNAASADWIETYPAIYLKANVQINAGRGTKENPYELFIKEN